MRRRRTAQANSVFLAGSSWTLDVSTIHFDAKAPSPPCDQGVQAALSPRGARRLERAARALAAAISLGSASPAFAQEDLTELVKRLQSRLDATQARLEATDAEVRSLKSQLKQYQGKSAKSEKKEKEAGKAAPDQPKGKDFGMTAAVSQPPSPPPYLLDVSRGLRIETEDKQNLFRTRWPTLFRRRLLDAAGTGRTKHSEHPAGAPRRRRPSAQILGISLSI